MEVCARSRRAIEGGLGGLHAQVVENHPVRGHFEVTIGRSWGSCSGITGAEWGFWGGHGFRKLTFILIETWGHREGAGLHYYYYYYYYYYCYYHYYYYHYSASQSPRSERRCHSPRARPRVPPACISHRDF